MKALCGCDYIRDIDGIPEERSQQGWVVWANREAKKRSTKHTTWHAVCAYIIWRNAMRISFASQPYNILT